MQIIVFLIVFGVVVTVHEFGHFYFAKKSGVLVREFAIGMGPKLLATHKNGTTYTIRAIPIGGYVRLAGRGDDVEPLRAGQMVSVVQDKDGTILTINTNPEKLMPNAVPFEIITADLEKEMTVSGRFINQEDVSTVAVSKTAMLIEKDGTSIQVAPIETQYEHVSPVKKMLINFGGPLNNFILGIVLFTVCGFLAGGVADSSNRVTAVDNGSALKAGVQTGDAIVAVNGQTTDDWNAVLTQLNTVKKDNATTVELTILTAQKDTTKLTVPFVDGYIGISRYMRTDFMSKLFYGFEEAWHVATSILTVLSNMVTKGFDINQFGGPVAIAQATGNVVQHGFIAILLFIAMLSVNLGVMNLLPIPVLDGGKLVFNIIELLRGKPVSPEKENIVGLVGVGVVVLLSIAILFNDILRLFH